MVDYDTGIKLDSDGSGLVGLNNIHLRGEDESVHLYLRSTEVGLLEVEEETGPRDSVVGDVVD